MSQERNLKPRFTGGDQLTGLKKLYHEIMMKNELVDGYGAYEVHFARGKSGISFGGNQIDLKKGEKDYRKDFVDILLNARDDKGNPFFTQSEIKSIAGEEKKGYEKFSEGKPVKEFFGQYLPRVNAALSSHYGRQKEVCYFLYSPIVLGDKSPVICPLPKVI